MNNSRENAAEALKILILEGLEEIKALDAEIKPRAIKKARIGQGLVSLDTSYKELTGQSLLDFTEEVTVADLAERFLKERGPMTADELVNVAAQHGRMIKKASLVATLVRYVERNKRFVRAPGRNRFAVTEGGQTKES